MPPDACANRHAGGKAAASAGKLGKNIGSLASSALFYFQTTRETYGYRLERRDDSHWVQRDGRHRWNRSLFFLAELSSSGLYGRPNEKNKK